MTFHHHHPIESAQDLARENGWAHDRPHDDTISLVVEGQWRAYAITLSLNPGGDALRVMAAFEMAPPRAAMARLLEALNLANDRHWEGAFCHWDEDGMTIWRGVLPVVEGLSVDAVVGNAVSLCEAFYPAFQAVCWGDRTPAAALDLAMGRAWGRA
ncbi:MAG: YbjN domain-containing protein [Paracoccaceae bacterium]